jgi:hypothetical protein
MRHGTRTPERRPLSLCARHGALREPDSLSVVESPMAKAFVELLTRKVEPLKA